MAFSSSSLGMTSTTCPRLSRKPPRSRNPSGERSTIRQGTLWGWETRLTTTLAPFFTTTRLDRRPSCSKRVGTVLSSRLICHMYGILNRRQDNGHQVTTCIEEIEYRGRQHASMRVDMRGE